jgi:excisionase family DNA binding protein
MHNSRVREPPEERAFPGGFSVPSLADFMQLQAEVAELRKLVESQNTQPKGWLSLTEAAAYCGMSKSTFYKRYRREIVFTRVGTKPMFRAPDLDDYMHGRVSSFPSTSNGAAPRKRPAPGNRRLSPDARQV